MKTRQDIIERLQAELEQWSTRQVQNPGTDYYLYHLPATEEHDGGLIISATQPPNPDFQLSLAERINGSKTVRQNLAWLDRTIINSLPILS